MQKFDLLPKVERLLREFRFEKGVEGIEALGVIQVLPEKEINILRKTKNLLFCLKKGNKSRPKNEKIEIQN